MARLPDGIDTGELTVAARTVLLDALEALGPHRDAVVLVGAQAVYQHTETLSHGLGVAAYTSDGDLGLDPHRLPGEPLIEEAMATANFSRQHPDGRREQPGMWWKRQIVDSTDIAISVDLLVPAELAPGTRRSVSVPPHDRMALHRVAGLGVAMEDHAPRTITALNPDADPRAMTVEVAGVPALLVAKAHKIGERLADQHRDRLVDKDASDVIGLMLASDPYDVAETLERLRQIDRVAEVTRQGLNYLRQLFGRPAAPGIAMATRALRTVRRPEEISNLAPAYVALLPA
jgi:hypothetical protein